MKDNDLLNKLNPNTIYWDEENQQRVRYSYLYDSFIPAKISVWDIDKPEYQPENLPRYERNLKGLNQYKKDNTYFNNNNTYKKEYPFFNKSIETNNSLQIKDKNTLLRRTDIKSSNIYAKNNSHEKFATKDKINLNEGKIKKYIGGDSIVNTNIRRYNDIDSNDKSYPIDTIGITQQFPDLGRISNFQRSKSVPIGTWSNMGNILDETSKNIYGQKVLSFIPSKTLGYTYLGNNPSLIANAEWPSSKINIGVNSLEQHQMLEEVIHISQYNIYNAKGFKIKDIPAMNLEAEAKFIEDIIYAYDLLERGVVNSTFSSKIFMGYNASDSEIKELSENYAKRLLKIVEKGYMTQDDLQFFNKIASGMSKEKNRRDNRDFNMNIEPLLLKSIVEIKDE